MPLSAKAIKNGCPRCWHCLNRLMFKRGGGFIFKEVIDGGGTKHRVHKDCLDKVIGDGVREVKAEVKK